MPFDGHHCSHSLLVGVRQQCLGPFSYPFQNRGIFRQPLQDVPDRANLLGAALLFFGIALLSQVLTVISTYVSTNVGWTATNALRADLARHCLYLDMPFHNARTPGEMIDRLVTRLPQPAAVGADTSRDR